MQPETPEGFRLSPQQLRLWRLLGDGADAYRAEAVLRLEGDLDRAALERALRAVVEHNEILRTAFPRVPGMALPLQVIRAADDRPFLQNGNGSRPEIDLESGDVLRAALFPGDDGAAELTLSLPALCADAVSLETLGDEILQAYARERGEPTPVQESDAEPPLQYADVAEWQNQLLESPDTADGVERWRELWREWDAPARLDDRLPFEEPIPAAGPFLPATVPVALDDVAFGALGAEEDPAAFFLTLWQALLWRSTGRPEVLVGVLQDGRRYEELRGALGLLARYVPVFAHFDTGLTVREAVARTREAAEDAGRRQELFDWGAVVDRNGNGSEPCFPICFDASDRLWTGAAAGLRATLAGRSALIDRFKLELVCRTRPDGPRLEIRYDPRRFRHESVALLAERLATLAAAAAAAPDALISELEILGEAERRQVLVGFNDAPPAAEPAGLHRRFEEQVRNTPDRLAVVGPGERLTYAELNARANKLARHLRGLGVGLETPVGICLERSADQVAAVLAVWKAGGAHLPLDPTQPADRLAFVLADTGAPVVLTQEKLAGVLPADGPRLVLVDAEDLSSLDGSDLDGASLPGSLAYVIYTSGSTGRPKGVLVEHRAPVNLLAGLDAAVYAHHDRRPLLASLNAPLFFDASIQQLVLLLAGHTLCLLPEAVRTDGAALLAYLREQGVDVFDCTPTQLRLLLAAGLLDGPPGKPDVVLAAGEAIDEATWEALRTSPGTAFYNIYGPTECTVDATARPVTGGAPGEPTIGRPLAGYELYLLDAALRPVPLGAPGEICVGGAGLARGYAGRPETTAERFVPHPFANRPGSRLYRTGDRGRHRPDGEIEFLGRIDQQVKIRGYRIEPGEIEAALAGHPYVREVVVAPWQDSPDHTLLVAYVIPTPEAPLALAGAHGELQRFLGDRLPAYMVPAAFVAMPSFPLTRSGKVDRKALPGPSPDRPDLGSEYAAPRDAREAALAEIWARVLRVERVGIDDSFFSLGGDSIRSLQLQSLAREQGLVFTVQDLFQHQTIRELAAVAQAETEDTAPALQERARFSLVPEADREVLARMFGGSEDDKDGKDNKDTEEIEDAYPLSLLQAGMVFHTEMSPETGIYQDLFSFTLRAKLDLPALEAAAARLTARHPVLRTSFHLARFSEPLQVVHREATIPVTVEDLRHLSRDEQEQALEEFLRTDARHPFEWTRPPLVRIRIHLWSDDRFQFTLTEHHAILDGWSVASILTELFNLYGRFAGGETPAVEPPPPPAFREFVALERAALASEESRHYWLSTLGDGARTRLPRLPTAPGLSEPLRHRTVGIVLQREAAEKLRDFARDASLPLKSVLLAAHLRVLSLLSGEASVLTGLSADNRPEAAGADQALGIFVSMVPLRLPLPGGTWADLARGAFEAEIQLLAHRRFPMAEVQRLLGGDPLFETAFNYVHFHVYQGIEKASSVTVEDRRGFELLDLPLLANFFVDPFSAHVGVDLNCHVNVLSEDQMDAIAGYYERTLKTMAENPYGRYDAQPLLPPEERSWLASMARGERDEPPLPLPALVAAQAERTPDAVAVASRQDGREEQLTYSELRQAAGDLAARLRAHGAGPGSRVGIALDRTPSLLVALLGTLESGAAYVPLDLAYPRERIAFMLEDSGLSILITERRLLGDLPAAEIPGVTPLYLDEPGDEPPTDTLAAGPGPDDPAYVIYTSGSTGRPKGVVVPHRALSNFLATMAREPGLGADDVLVAVTSLSFDIAGLELYLPLTVGAHVVLASHEQAADGAFLRDLVNESGATVLQGTPSTWRLLLEAGWPGKRGFRALVGGEAVPGALVEELRPRVSAVWNVYGPTETTIWSTAADLSTGPVFPVHIGRSIGNTQTWVVDGFGDLVPVGVPGELRIGGLGLAQGYHGRPDLTADRFVPDPFGGGVAGIGGGRLYRTGDLARLRADGTLECLGRLDFQVKVRGFRIELGEVEAALEAQPGVRQAVVTATGDTPGGAGHQLAAYLVFEPGAEPSVPGLRDALRQRLPEYMVPAWFTVLESLPLTPNGKVDRRALPAPEPLRAVRDDYVAPRNPTEEQLAALWAESLRLDRVGIHDNFLELGGHSLLAIRLISRIRGAFEVDLPLRSLYESLNVAELAVAIVKAQAERTERGALERLLAELEDLSDEEARSLLASDAGKEPRP